MSNTIQISVRNSELTIPKEKRIFLSYPADGLVRCSIAELEDGIDFLFDIKGLEASEKLLSKAKEEQLRFLINCADLAGLHEEYSFSLSLSNIMTDINLRPWILLRDAQSIASGSDNGGHNNERNSSGHNNERNNGGHNNERNSRQAFLSKYKSLIGSFLLPKYNYDDFEKGGEDLSKKNKLLSELFEMVCTLEIKAHLTKEYQKTIKENEQTKVSVPKRNVLALRIAVPVLGLALLVVSFFAFLAFWNDIPYRNQVIAANEAYIAGNPLQVQQALSGFSVSELSFETRHILSRSYVSTEPLNEAQRSNIMMGLSLMADTSIFDYWIHLGRLEFYEAIDIAQRFGDNELLLFAYLRQEAAVRVDPNLSGAEMVAALNYIEGRINALQRDRDDAVELLGGEGEDEDDAYGHYYEYDYYHDYEYEYDLQYEYDVLEGLSEELE